MRSKPPIQVPTARPSATAGQDVWLVTASHAPTGATNCASASSACGKSVNRLPYE